MFKGQMTPTVKRELQSLNIELVPVPANMMHFFQPLDPTVNGSAKKFIRRKFVAYYSNEVKSQLDSGKELDDVEVDFRMSKIKPLHAKWLIDMYNYFTNEKGSQIVMKGWKKAGIVNVFKVLLATWYGQQLVYGLSYFPCWVEIIVIRFIRVKESFALPL